MFSLPFILIMLFLSAAMFAYGKQHVVHISKKQKANLNSLPSFYGWCSLIWLLIPAIIIASLFDYSFNGENLSLKLILIIISSLIISGVLVKKFIVPNFRARKHVESWGKLILFLSAFVSIAITVMIIFSLLFEAIRFFEKVSILEFLFGTKWSPQTALRADQAASSGSFGAIPVFIGTFLITIIAMTVATPLGIYSAVYLSEYASKTFRNIAKPVLELLAGVPTVVYGYFAVISVAPFIRSFGQAIGLDVASESALTAGIVMGVMIIPFVLSLSDDVINAVPNSLREASLGLGATRAETIKKVILPAALPGIMGAILLAISRAIGETMIVVMAAGFAANLTANPLQSVTTVTVQIVTLLTGDQEFESAKTLAAFALGLTLFTLTLMLNILSTYIVKKYQEQYD